MPNPNTIRYSTATQSGALRKGNFYLGVTDRDYGPSNVTGYYSGATSSGYISYIWDGSEIRYNKSDNDTQLTNFYSGLETFKNFALPLNSWAIKRSDIVEITDGSVPPPNAGAKVWKCTVNTTSYANTLHRMWNFGDQNGIIGALGNYYYRYYFWASGTASNTATCSVQMDIADGGGVATVTQTIGTSSTWQLLSAIDYTGPNYNANKFMDMSFNSANGDIFYISSIHVVSLNVATASQLLSLQNLPFPGYIDYSATKPLTFTAASQCFLYAITKPTFFISNKTFEPIITDGLQLNYDASFVTSYPQTGDTWYNLNNTNNGTLTNGPTFSSANGGLIGFDGVDDHINLGTTPAIDFTGGLTIEVLVLFSSLGAGGWERFIDLTHTSSGTSITFCRNSTTTNIVFQVRNITGGDAQRRYVSTTNPIVTNQMLMFTTTLPGGTAGDPVSGCKMFRNGVEIAGGEQVAGEFPRVPTTITRNVCYIGRSPFVGNAYLNGRVYSVRMYNRVLSSSEILQNYQSSLPKMLNQNVVTGGLSLYLDAGYSTSFTTASNTWFDVSGYNRNGTLTNGPTFSSDGGGSILFDGVNDYVDNIGGVSNFSFIQNTGIFTISAWVKLTDLSTARYFLGNNDAATTSKGFYMGYTGASGTLRLTLTYGVSGQVTISVDRSNIFTDTNWVHVCCVGDGLLLRTYRNGTFIGSNSFGTFSTGDSTRTLSVGRINNVNSIYWKGNISEVSIYDRALSASEVSQNFNAQKSVYGL